MKYGCMAKIIPSIEKAKQSRQPPTECEIYLLEYLSDNFDPDADVIFNRASMVTVAQSAL